MSKHILVPVDDSDRARDALEYALEEHVEDSITALHVVNPANFYAAVGIEGNVAANLEELQQGLVDQAESLLENIRERAETEGVEIETDHTIGAVADSIVTYADEHEFDHIVIGSHGRSGATRVLLGSVAESVARRAPVSVTIVR